MAKAFLYITMVSLVFTDWLVFKLGTGNRYITWIPEILSIVMIIYLVISAAITKKLNLDAKYFIILIVYIFHIFMGLLFNPISSGTVVAGLRLYLKFIPFFLLPAFYDFSEKEVGNFVRFMFFLSLIQCPVAFYQRFVSAAHIRSGDPVGGTLGMNTSGILTVFLICGAAFVIGYYLRNRVNLVWLVIFLGVLLAPTGLNETKVTYFLLPPIFILPFIFSARDRFKIKKILPLALLMVFSFMAWKAGYDYFQIRDRGWGIETFMSQKGRIEQYTSSRFIPIISAYEFASKDMIHFLFGRGAGNVTGSFSEKMQGADLKKYAKFGPKANGVSSTIWELGVGGLLLIFVFLGVLFYDAIKYASRSNYFGTFSVSMISVIAVFGVSFLYFHIMDQNIITYPFFFLAGFIASGKYYRRAWE